MEGVAINWLAVIVAAISSFIVGGIWYGPLFGKAWGINAGYCIVALTVMGAILGAW